LLCWGFPLLIAECAIFVLKNKTTTRKPQMSSLNLDLDHHHQQQQQQQQICYLGFTFLNNNAMINFTDNEQSKHNTRASSRGPGPRPNEAMTN
jgi:hypothetical protein